MSDPFENDVSREIWDIKYRVRDEERSVGDTWRRVARALAPAERHPDAWTPRFLEALEGFRFLPGGRILAGAGTGRRVTLFNCFVMGRIEDSIDGIFDGLKEGALTMQQGGGVGYDFSTLRPRGTAAHSAGTIASGPVSFMRIWDSTCATLLSTGARRGAMMATLRCDHPDVEELVDAKRDPRELRHFNVSVLVQDALVEAVRLDESWPLVFPAAHLHDDRAGGEIVTRSWPGEPGPVPCRVLRRVPARALWARIMRATYDVAEPGVLFVDRINTMNNLWYREQIGATNPCGEIPLPPYGACDLGSIDLAAFVRDPLEPGAWLDLEAIRTTTRTAVRMLDDVIDVSRFPLEAQAAQARGTRRIGLGITGLGDALIMLGLHYGTPEGRAHAAEAMQAICHEAYRASIELACEKGAFPFFDRDRHLEGPFVRALPGDIRDGIAAHGIRNSHLVAIAPTGTISLLANDVSSGIEPVFAFEATRKITVADGSIRAVNLEDPALRRFRALRGPSAPLPSFFVDAMHLSPAEHLEMQAALQPFVDGSISKTIHVPEDQDFAEFARIYERAYDLGLKGCTTFRPNAVTGSIVECARCAAAEREPD